MRQRLTPSRRRWPSGCGLAAGVWSLAAAPALAAARPWPSPQDVWPALTVILAVLLVAMASYPAWRARRACRRSAKVRDTLASIDPMHPATPASTAVNAINAEFDAWNLSAAERDVAWFLLKGLPMKEIARLRGASEATVRKQARAIYTKAGLDGRSDLAAHILDRCLVPAGPPPAPALEGPS